MTWRAAASRRAAVLLLAMLAAVAAVPAVAQADKLAVKGKPWAALTVQEQQALHPLKTDWASLEPARQRKWLEVAARFPSMTADERGRIQERMAQWAALTPGERTQARLQFLEARQLSPGERQAKWQEYQALSDEQKRALAQRAAPAASGADAAAAVRPGMAASAVAPKSNVVKAQPAQAPGVRPVSPSIVQAKPGATTLPMTSRPAPPAHHLAGLPKIAATPDLVDPTTLLPRRPAQTSAKADAAAAAPAPAPALAPAPAPAPTTVPPTPAEPDKSQ